MIGTLSHGVRIVTKQIFRVNRPTVSAESFDDEVVIIHFENGNYYSLDAFGTRVWEALEAGTTREQVLEHVRSRYRAEKEAVSRKLDMLMDQLLREELVCETEGDPGSVDAEPDAQPVDLPDDAGKLLKFDDMQELLLLDPIHDVDEAGWPNTSPDTAPDKHD